MFFPKIITPPTQAWMHHRGQFYALRTNVKPAFVSVTRVAGLRINVLDVPEVAQAGHTVRLTCDYDLERARLYQVKVYLVVKCSNRCQSNFLFRSSGTKALTSFSGTLLSTSKRSKCLLSKDST